jgi:hypothetical protein
MASEFHVRSRRSFDLALEIASLRFSLRKPKPLDSRQTPRALLRRRAQDLARESAVGVATIRRAELADGETSMTAANDLAIRRALELAGVDFIDENGGGPGVRSASSRGRGPPSDRWRAEQSVPRREWRMPGHKFSMVLVTHVVPGLLRVRGAENWLRLAKIPAGAHGPLVRLGRRRRDL